jgi:hypothetical protein
MQNTHITEAAWKPITRGASSGNSKGAYSINAYAASTSWYNNHLDTGGTRLNRLRRYNEADKCSVEISRALDILSEDISSSNADDEYPFQLIYPDDVKVNKTTLKIMDGSLKLWAARTGFENDLFDRVRRTLKYGATFYKKLVDGSLKELPTERFVGYVLSETDEEVVTHYIYNPGGELLENSGKIITTLQRSLSVGNFEIIPVGDLVVFKTTDTPFGMSVIEPVYRTWRQMSLIEDAVIIYRVVRAPERRVFYIDVGNLQGPKREAAIEKQRLRLMQKQATKNNQLTTEYDPHSTSEDIFIPTNSTGKGSRIETLPGGQNLGETGDLEWFAKKLAAGLRIPYSMIDTQGDQQTQYSDMRVGQMYQVEMRYMGYVKRFQRKFEIVMHENFFAFCTDREIVPPEGAKFDIVEPMSFSLYKEIEINQTQLNVFNSTLQISSLSKKFSLQKYLNFDQDELKHNEESKLRELGISDETIKTMEQSEIDNLVYGTPNAKTAQKFGLDIPEGGARAW